ncbi:putative bifunctional diguanylate cyclase/phosphodiesterase [Denitratisoma oestradiolicum]|uniref:Response regulator receiver modulated diguanylate cyclase/phosphodiesterase with PAS/PAC sensor(S) n=1 Tax=Denitratisoma oestradiolicum TaxID=311182 RepID=A0A6S6XWZ6_9PROT|nr:EAL domain-containing protein [Denitratisoma oestradiolicum]TWO79784.1 diguanylate cyclase [Denitratisoma oestradiolicum]CAB1369474.1 Response regulator receiver modulated diguanylate cyclase/phosphodiesterase with PAS/PAC sensor(S) [Denitratisoma oestradiolicum]
MRILLVEDNPGDARLLELLLKEAHQDERITDYEFTHAASLGEGLQTLGQGAFDIILIDLSLPDAHGRDSYLRIQRGAPDLPVVALTGNDDEGLAAELVAAGAQDYLVKGQVDARLLARALRYAIERKRGEEKLRLVAQVFEVALEGILVTDAAQSVISVNRAFSDITGLVEGRVVGRPMFGLHQSEGLFHKVWATQSSEEHWQGEAICHRASGETFPVWLNVNAVKNTLGSVTHFVAAFNDITALKRSEERLRHIAHHDALTNLPNRLLFEDRLDQALAHVRRSASLAAVLFIDLDRFKLVNDTLGHTSGDILLRTAAQRLRGCVREVDTVARLGGDEFAVILGDLNSREDAAVVARKVLEAMGGAFELDSQEVFVTASIGIAMYGREEQNQVNIMEQADIAMYHAKRTGRNAYHFYAEDMNIQSRQRLALETDLRRALERNEYLLYYQPQVDPSSGEMIGVEALLRWQHRERGLVMPAEFIPLLEETGMIIPVGEWVMRTACIQAHKWLDEGRPLRMAVNLSARQLRQEDLAERVRSILLETGLPPGLLEIELTETIVMENAGEAVIALNRLKDLGVRIALDDFGTGASSLAYLKHFPIDTLKISSAIIVELEDETDAAIAGAVISMARNMKLSSVAEGVENVQQLDFLRREQCDSIQGYLISRPMSAQAFAEMLDKLPPQV